ncbi:MAG: glycosyltransferase [Bacteroidetes bacterium]|nr:MAG: glycosyltransferase [Bacteroidota bacterium]TAG87509.1 MAG: glycosyltransferase [Bacteroidota bacterium]
MQKTKITYIVSDTNRYIGFEWVVNALKSYFDFSFILLNSGKSYLEDFMMQNDIPTYFIQYNGKKDVLKSFFQVRKTLKKIKPAVVHCHFFDACFVGLPAAKSLFIKKIIYTRHYSTLHHEYFPTKGVLYDKIFNFLATDIIAISNVVKDVLIIKEKVSPKKVHLICHGMDFTDFRNITQNSIEMMREKYNLNNTFPIVGVIARYTEWKGIQHIVVAFQQLLSIYADAKLILLNAHGDYAAEIQKLLSQLPAKNYIEIKFETEIKSFYSIFDIYVHVPTNAHIEAFGLTYIEAIITRTPSVFTLSGIAHQVVEHEKNALCVPYKDSKAIYEAMIRYLTEPELKNKLQTNDLTDIEKYFGLTRFVEELKVLYEK